MTRSGLGWPQVLGLMAQACAASEEERRVLLVLADRAYHVREVLGAQAPGDEALLGFVAWRDDPALTRRSDETSLILIPPGQILRVEILGYDATQGQSFGF